MPGDGRRFASTYLLPADAAWNAQVRTVPVRGLGATVRDLLAATAHGEAAILRGFVGARERYVDLVAAIVLGRAGRSVLVTECTWQPGSRALDRLLRIARPPLQDVEPRSGARVARFAVSGLKRPGTHFSVLSRAERASFPGVWGVPAEQVHFTAFCATAALTPPAGSRTGVFAGGDSLRDYRVLLDAAPAIRGPVRIATRLPAAPAPPNVTIGPLPHAAYEAAARSAAVVVVPLLAGTRRSAGQQTYLNAMGLGTPVVVSDVAGVRDHVVDGATGLVVPAGDAAALAHAVNALLADGDLRARLGAAARAAVLADHLPEHYHRRVLDIAAATLA